MHCASFWLDVLHFVVLKLVLESTSHRQGTEKVGNTKERYDARHLEVKHAELHNLVGGPFGASLIVRDAGIAATAAS
jgi:hypothetical protein